MVLQYGGYVRRVSTQKPRWHVQGILLAAGQLLGAASHCVVSPIGKAKEGFQRAGWASHRDAIIDLVELQVPFHIHGVSSLYYA